MLLKRHVEFNQTVLIINFLSLNFTSIEIEGERVTSIQKERTLVGGGGGGGGCAQKRTRVNKEEEGGSGSKLGNLERTYFLNVPY